MRAVLLDVPQHLLEERRRLGLDESDECWEGVLHMVPPASSRHGRMGAELMTALLPLAQAKGLVGMYEAGVFDPAAGESNYRVPDLVFARPEHVSDRGVEGQAELVVEILSPNDETYQKLDFYAAQEMQELLVVHPERRTVELFVLRGGRLLAAVADEEGRRRSASLGVTFETVEGPHLRVSWPGGSAESDPGLVGRHSGA